MISNNTIEKLKNISQDDLLKAINTCYDKALCGLPGIKSCYKLAEEYLKKYPNSNVAVKKMIKTQVVKCTTSGFITNLGGLIALPIAIPADLTACIYVFNR